MIHFLARGCVVQYTELEFFCATKCTHQRVYSFSGYTVFWFGLAKLRHDNLHQMGVPELSEWEFWCLYYCAKSTEGEMSLLVHCSHLFFEIHFSATIRCEMFGLCVKPLHPK